MTDASINPPTQPLRWARALLLLIAIKAAWFFIDARPRLFLGDSASYLLGASSDWMPPDRSFTYPWFLRYAVMPWQSSWSLALVQSLIGVVSAWLLWLLLRRRLGIPEWLALSAAAVFACEPAQVFYERMVMAEACGGLALIAMFSATLEYVASGRVRWLVAMQCLGLIAVSLRMNLLPVALAMGVLAPLVLWWENKKARPLTWRSGAHLMLAVVLLAGLHGGYRHFIAQHFGTAPAWIARSGLMKFGLVAPLVKPEHLWAEGVSPNVLSLLRHDIHDSAERNPQMWAPYGLADVLGFNDNAEGDALAGRIARRALRDDPLGLLRLGLRNAAMYFDPGSYRPRLEVDAASTQQYGSEPQALAQRVLKASIVGSESVESPARRWFRLGSSWLLACWLALAPLALLAWWRLRHSNRAAAGDVLLLFALGLVLGQLLFSATISFRYLHPMPAFVLIAVAVLFAPRVSTSRISMQISG